MVVKNSPWLALLLIGLIAGWPLLTTEIGGGHDTSVHFWRAVEAERLLRAGILWPRWAFTMAWGYGYPLFLFQGPLSAQLAALLHLAGLRWSLALNGAYLLGLVTSGLTLYLLARRLWGEVGGWCAASIFLFIPYHLYVAYFRASLSETVAWLFPPLILWGISDHIDGGRLGLEVAGFSLAALAMTHPVSFFLFAPTFVLWTLTEAAASPRHISIGRAFAPLILGAAAGAFVWFPALAERHNIQLGRATTAWVFNYRANFLPPAQLLPLPRNADPQQLNDWPARGLGALPALAAAAGLLTWRRRDRRERLRLAALGLLTTSHLWLTTPSARPLWDAIPLLGAFQFPWRFLSPAALTASLLAGAAAQHLTRRLGRAWPAIALAAALTVAHWGWLYPPHAHPPAFTTPSAYLRWEAETDLIGTTASRELLPRWVIQPPPPDAPVTVAILAGEPPPRLDTATLPDGAHILDADYTPPVARLTLETPVAFTARWHAFYFPGWRVRVDGRPVPSTPEAETGLLTFPVPAGHHTLDVHFSETPLRRAVDLISLCAGVSIILAARRNYRHNTHHTTGEPVEN